MHKPQFTHPPISGHLGSQFFAVTNNAATNILVQVSAFVFIIYLLIYLLAVLGLHCCARASSSCGEQGLLFVAVHGLLIAVALRSTGSRHAGFSSCGARALEHRLSSCGAWA